MITAGLKVRLKRLKGGEDEWGELTDATGAEGEDEVAFVGGGDNCSDCCGEIGSVSDAVA